MRFFYQNGMGNSGYFSDKNLVKAIYTAWNIEADLYLLNDGIKKLNDNIRMNAQCKCIFAPLEGNEINSDLLLEFGYKVADGDKEVEIIEIKTGKVIKCGWGRS